MLAQEAAARTIEDQRLSGKEWYAANAEGYEDLILNEDEAEQLMEQVEEEKLEEQPFDDNEEG